MMLARLAASGELGQHPEQLDLSLDLPARRVTDLGVLVDSTSAAHARDGLRVLGTTPGGTAARLGLRPGDVVLAVNGTSLRNLGADTEGRALAASTLKSAVEALPESAPLHLDVLRDGVTVALNAPVQSVYLPALRMQLGAAALAAVAPATTNPPAASCGRISTFDVAPRGDRQYHAHIVQLDGTTPGPTGQETYRVRAGEHHLLVTEDIPTQQMGVGEIATLRRNTTKPLTMTVAANTTAMVAAQFHPDKASDLAHGTYWDPVVWRAIPQSCP